MNKKGFTLIELLIVIALLGVLAVGLLATIDPFEQLKKGRDTSTRNIVEEFYNAALRYYAINKEFPWEDEPQTAEDLSDGVMNTYVSMIYDAGELKEAFLYASGLEDVYVSSTSCDGSGSACDDLTVCFNPESKAFRGDNNTKFGSAGTEYDETACGPTINSCYWCIR